MALNAAKTLGARIAALRGLRPGQIVPEVPRNAEPRTGLSMGEHAAQTALESQVGREEQDELTVASHRNLAAAYDRGFFDDLVTPYLGLTRDLDVRHQVDGARRGTLVEDGRVERPPHTLLAPLGRFLADQRDAVAKGHCRALV
jgi:acetyl-CoA acetyltransferase